MLIFKRKNFFCIFLFFYFGFIFFKLLSKPLPFYDWDEAIYLQVGREMIEQKSFIPLWQGKYWLDKPPLVMILYGLIPKIFPFLKPEISTRLFNIILNLIFLILLYQFALRLLKSKRGAFITMMLSSFTPLFIQRAYTVNMDIFLALGWLGFFYFYPNFGRSTLFLSLAIFSKSLLGFYPLVIVLMIEVFKILKLRLTAHSGRQVNDERNQKKNITEKNIIMILSQFFVFSLWYLYMILRFKKDFIVQHFYESHIKRVTASIEFHFGEKIFYFLEIYRQFSFFVIFSLIGLLLIFYFFWKKKINLENFFQLNYFLPWFLFLNITKTKIFWYVYPAIPQFALYFGFFITFLEKRIFSSRTKSIFLLLICLLIFSWGIGKNQFLEAEFSSKDKFYQFANFAKNHCQKIYFIPEKNHRKSIAELEKMNLTITTTRWWGGHPALVYYTDNKISFVYDQNEFLQKIEDKKKGDCFSFFKDEIALKKDQFELKLIKNFEDILLFK